VNVIVPPKKDEAAETSEQGREQQIGLPNRAGTQAIAKKKDAQHCRLRSWSLLAFIAFWS
jgi:hypothetical protein